MKHFRIKLIGNESILEYFNPKQCIYEIWSIKALNGDGWRCDLQYAYNKIKEEIRYKREVLRNTEIPSGNRVIRMLRDKRRHKANEALKAKKPLTKNKHVGVEIEFISSSRRNEITLDLAMMNLTQFVELKGDGSVKGKNEGECGGSCRGDCSCAECGEQHFCDDEDDCDRRVRNYEGHNERFWEVKEDCDECDETETIDDCDCGGHEIEEGVKNLDKPICKGEHIVCQGHCKGHYCLGSEDHDDYECNCECSCDNECGHEIAIVAKSSEITEVISKVCDVLKKHNAEVNGTCGLHVHLDMRGYDEKRAFSNLVKSQKFLYSMVPASRYKNHYCAPNHKRTMCGYTGRYYGINPQSYREHKTIEIRLHSGTVNAKKINNWIKILQKIAYSNKRIPVVERLSDLTNRLIFNAELISYMKDRLDKFKNGRDYRFQDDVVLTKTPGLVLVTPPAEEGELLAA